MNRWISVMVVVVAPLLWQCSEKKEVVTTTESATQIGQATNPSPIPAAPEPFPTVTTQEPLPDPVPATASAPAAGPPLRIPAAAAPLADPIATVRRIDLRDAERLFNSGDAIVVDVRSEADYAKSHVRGAINIPVALVQSRASELPRDKMIITYCTWQAEHTSAGAVLNLNVLGVKNAAALIGGFDAWKNAGLPVDGME